jgi:hypothetical protein
MFASTRPPSFVRWPPDEKRCEGNPVSRYRSVLTAAVAVLALARPVAAQQRPLTTEDPEPIGAGRLLIEGGIDYARDIEYPVSGLEGNLWRLPTLGVSIGISSIAEVQIDGGPYDHLAITQRTAAPLSDLPEIAGATSTHDVEDLVVGTKIRFLPEAPDHPAMAFRFATSLPNAEWQRGIGLDTTDFYASLLMAKTVQSVRVVGNIGVGILGDPTDGHRQNDVLTYGMSLARAVTDRVELVGDVNGRVSTQAAPAFPGTESRSLVKLGGRYTRGSVRLDAAVVFGLTAVDEAIGFTTGFTYVFQAFNVP